MLRLWRLGAINDLVFDEVYYVEFAVDYLQGQEVFDAHPPLGKYLIAIAISLAQRWADPLGWPQNDLAGVWLSPISYRWLNAVVGAMLPVLVGYLAYQLVPGSARYHPQPSAASAPPAAAQTRLHLQRQTFGLLAAGIMLLEGFTLVESRLALINIYWLVLGCLGHVGLLRTSRGWRLLGGAALGASVAVKWNGAGFWLGLTIFWGLSHWFPRLRALPVAQLKAREWLVYGVLVPALTYGLLWLPHLWLNPTGFLEIHQRLWQVHQSIANQAAVHPYCSSWYSWPLMLRPLAYFYETHSLSGGSMVVTDIHGMGNPLGWWLSTAAVVALLGRQVMAVQSRFSSFWLATSPVRTAFPHPVSAYLLVNFAANWLPWMAVSRCTFLYLYLGSLIFAQMALAWLLSGWIAARQRFPVYLLLTVIAVGFLFWLPLFIGLPLVGDGFSHRMWLRSWI